MSQDPEGETTADLFALPRSRYADPKFSWFESIGVTGIVFLNSAELGAEYENNVFVGDYVFGNLSRFELNQKRDGFVLFDNLADKIANNSNERNDARIGEGFGSISALHVGRDGFLYVVSISDGSVYAVHPVVQVAAATVPNGVMDSAYNADLTVSGGTGPYTLTVLSGALPPGLSITGTAITGTPTEMGIFSFTLQIAETGGAVPSKATASKCTRPYPFGQRSYTKGAPAETMSRGSPPSAATETTRGRFQPAPFPPASRSIPPPAKSPEFPQPSGLPISSCRSPTLSAPPRSRR